MLHAVVLLVTCAAFAGPDKPQLYLSPDKSLEAVIRPTGLKLKESDVVVRRWTKEGSGEEYFAWSLGSRDGKHGQVVKQAGWTADSRFFVFLAKSTGRAKVPQVWFWDRKDGEVRNLEKKVGTIADKGFILRSPDVLDAYVLDMNMEPGRFTVSLKDVVEHYRDRVTVHHLKAGALADPYGL